MMNTIVMPSARFALDTVDNLWVWSKSLNYSFWTRYLDVYDEVHLLVRAESVPSQPTGTVLASGVGVKALPLPFYQGPVQFFTQYPHLQTAIRKYVLSGNAIHLRIPLMLGSSVIRTLPINYPYGVEIVGDPYDVFGPEGVRHPLRPLFRWWGSRTLRAQCAQASATAYVTEHTLQKRYPPNPNAFTTHYSSVELSDDAFAVTPRRIQSLPIPVHLILVGSLEQMYKAPDILIDAVAKCVAKGLELHLTIVGDGKHRAELEARAVTVGLGTRVTFTGKLDAGAAVREKLDKSDIFILPSRTEGLPRALIEAMARGLPCIGSTVGGIPELLPAEDMVAPGDADALAHKVMELLNDPQRMSYMSARNLEEAKKYHENLLRERRIAFYQSVRDRTQAWIDRQR